MLKLNHRNFLHSNSIDLAMRGVYFYLRGAWGSGCCNHFWDWKSRGREWNREVNGRYPAQQRRTNPGFTKYPERFKLQCHVRPRGRHSCCKHLWLSWGVSLDSSGGLGTYRAGWKCQLNERLRSHPQPKMNMPRNVALPEQDNPAACFRHLLEVPNRTESLWLPSVTCLSTHLLMLLSLSCLVPHSSTGVSWNHLPNKPPALLKPESRNLLLGTLTWRSLDKNLYKLKFRNS